VSASLLKFLAVIFMTFDHINEFFPDTPILFRWVGRLAAPIFIFLTGESYRFTSNKKRYIFRLYISSIIMSLINYISLVKYIEIENNIFRTLLICVLSYYLYEKAREKKYRDIIIFIIWQIITFALLIVCVNLNLLTESFATIVLAPLLGSIFNMEGGITYVILALFLYIYHNNKKAFSFSLAGYAILYTAILQYNILARIMNRVSRFSEFDFRDIYDFMSVAILNRLPENIYRRSLLVDNYYWMMLFSLPLILLYNGKKGKGAKYFFYLYYPLHLIILSIIANHLIRIS